MKVAGYRDCPPYYGCEAIGTSVAGVGGIDGDGIPDAAIGSDYTNYPVSYRGAVYVLTGQQVDDALTAE